MSDNPNPDKARKPQPIPFAIWALGSVSLFMDASSEWIHSLLPVFMSTVLGASMTSIGVIEGIAESTALITKIFSGAISDFFGKRKLPTLIGYGLAALSKPLFPLAQTIGMVLGARFIDRIGKGIRDAPRDALIGEIAPPEIRGACYGLRQALDTVGAIIGPILALLFMIFFSGNLRLSMGMAVVPAVISVAILIFAVREPKYQHKEHGRSLFRHIDFYLFPAVYWKVVAIGALLSLARFSEAFLILRAQSIGLPYTFLPLVLILMNLVYAIVAYPSGRLSDKISRDTVIIISTGFLLTSQILLGGAVGFLSLFLGIGFWGLHLGFSQGVIAAFVMDTSSPRLRGTAFGLFSFIFGVTQLAASILAGILWDRYGASATFFTGAGFSLLALLGLLAMRAQKNKSEKGG